MPIGYVPYNGQEIRKTIVTTVESFLQNSAGLGIGNSYHALEISVHINYKAYPVHVTEVINARDLEINLAGKKINTDVIEDENEKAKVLNELIESGKLEAFLKMKDKKAEDLQKFRDSLFSKANEMLSKLDEEIEKIVTVKSQTIEINTSVPNAARKEFNIPLPNQGVGKALVGATK